MEKQRRKRGLTLLALYLASIVGSALAVIYIGPVPVGFGLQAPAGAYIIGITLVLRDLTQDQLGPKATYCAIIAGTIISAIFSPQVAIGSALGFLVSETLDMIAYTPIRSRGHLAAGIIISNAISITADSYVFLKIAFGDLTFFWGQVWAKVLFTILSIIVLSFIYKDRDDKRPAYIVARENKAKAQEKAKTNATA